MGEEFHSVKTQKSRTADVELNGDITLIVPFYNESARWNVEYWTMLSHLEGLNIVFVDDGSTDNTSELVKSIISESVQLLTLERNSGKAEAVRLGLAIALERPCAGVGFLDADGAFPVEEVKRIIALSRVQFTTSAECDAVWSSRVKLAGRVISRSSYRHYLSRCLLTLLNRVKPFDVYDPQSGFKLFRRSDVLQDLLTQPFKTRWFVDLEIYYRWNHRSGATMAIWEEPVMSWRDVSGSKIRGRQLIRVFRDLVYICLGSKS